MNNTIDLIGGMAFFLALLIGFPSFFFVRILWFFLLFCVAWAPFAALVCALIASRKTELEVWKHALAGAVYSALLLMPWIYLVMRMLGRRFSRKTIRPIYICLYLLWMCLIVGGAATIYIFFDLGGMEDLEVFTVPLVPLVIGMPIWTLSFPALQRRDRYTADSKEDDTSDTSILLEPVFIIPFAGASVTN